MSKAIVVDVDLTLVDTLSVWVAWWEKKTESKFPWEKIGPDFSINNALQTKMSRDMTTKFWEQCDLYDNLEPLPGSIQTLKWLSAKYEIFFVSHCHPKHLNSKRKFLDKFFPFHDGLINTQHKYAIDADIYFDDHVAFTQKIVAMKPNATVYQFVTRDNEYQLVDGAIPMKTWEGFIDELHFA